MKKMMIFTAIAATMICSACSSIQYTPKKDFNGLELIAEDQKISAHIDTEVWGLYFLGIPLITPDITVDEWRILLFTDNVVTADAIEYTTRCAKKRGFSELSNVTTLRQSSFNWGFLIYECHVSANASKPIKK